MFGFGSGKGNVHYTALYLNAEVAVFIIIGIIGSFPLFPQLKKWYQRAANRWETQEGKTKLRLLKSGYTLVYTFYLTFVLLIGTMFITAGTYNPFIYFRF
jgi:hypothetical protein